MTWYAPRGASNPGGGRSATSWPTLNLGARIAVTRSIPTLMPNGCIVESRSSSATMIRKKECAVIDCAETKPEEQAQGSTTLSRVVRQ